MKTLKFTLSALLITVSPLIFAQTGQWKLAGNNLTGSEKLGSTNNAALNFITGNKTRMSLTGAGNLNISSDQSSIQFALPGANPKPMMIMFPSGDANTSRMVIAHSPSFPNYGLQYNDFQDRFDFLSAGTSIFNVNLGSRSVGVTSSFNVSGNSTFTGTVGIGTSTPGANLHVFRGSAGVTGFFNAPLIVENSTHNYINLLSPNNTESGILFGNPTSNIDGGIVYNNSATSKGFQFRTSTNNTRMVLTSAGSLGINTINPATELHIVQGDGGFWGGQHHGLRLQNATTGHQWTFYTDSYGTLVLFRNNDIVGFFDETGEYQVANFKTKNNMEQAPEVLQKIMQLNVKKYHSFENKSADKLHFGMIPQEVEKVFPEVVSHGKKDGSNDYYAMNNSAFGVLAIKAIQEQQKKIEEQEQANQQQQQKITTLEDRIAKLEALISKGGASSTGSSNNMISKEISSATLEQNQPNPFNQSTIIRYHLTQGNMGQINIYDANGTLVKTLKANESGQAVINANDLHAGTYTYTLVVDGKTAASKKMVLIK